MKPFHSARFSLDPLSQPLIFLGFSAASARESYTVLPLSAYLQDLKKALLWYQS